MTMSSSSPSRNPAAGAASAPTQPAAADDGAAQQALPPEADVAGGSAPKKMKSSPLSPGVVDPESNIRGSVEDLDGEPCDVMLARVDPSSDSDEFFVLQLIRWTDGTTSFVVFARGGRTGATGRSLEHEFDKLEGAVARFEKEFERKTGSDWKDRGKPPKPGGYRFVAQNFAEKRAGFSGGLWQYWVDDGVDGKGNGWYDYSDSRQVERLYQEHRSNPNAQELCQRYISSGRFTYLVDLVQMTQTNVAHPDRTSRCIRRLDVNGGAVNATIPTASNYFRSASAPQAPVGHAASAPPPLPPAVPVPPPGANHFRGASAPRQAPIGRSASAPHVLPPAVPVPPPGAILRSATAPPRAPTGRAGLATRVSRAIGRRRSSSASQVLHYTAPQCLSVGIPSDVLSAPPASCDMTDGCVICHEKLEEGPCVALSACGHVFHNECIQLAFKSNPQCPVCRVSIGKPQGKSPSGTMTVSISPIRCAGFRENSILIAYNLPGGTQLGYHDHPGRGHGGKRATAYLPNNADGRDLIKRLKFAWSHGLSFTVGTSFTTGLADQCTWASVHHKTSPSGGSRGHGYPDPDYFDNCNGELDGLGVPPARGLDDDGNAK